MNAVHAVHAEFFDGRSSRPQAAQVHIDKTDLVIDLPGQSLRFPLATLNWPERSKSAARLFLLPNEASLQAPDDHTWTQLATRYGIAENPVVTWQQSGVRIAAALVLICFISAATLIWGVPLAARVVLVAIPTSVDTAIGRQTMAQLDEHNFKPSQLSPEKQLEIRNRMARVVATAWANQPAPQYQLLFRASNVGPNAFALPGGSIVLTDALVELADGELDMVIGVLSHELGHVEGRHGMRSVSQSLLAAAAMAVVLGDASSLITSAPLILGSLAYSRDLEREADQRAIELMQANDISPRVMAGFFRKILDEAGKSDLSDENSAASNLGLLFSSHPEARERIKTFEDAALH